MARKPSIRLEEQKLPVTASAPAARHRHRSGKPRLADVAAAAGVSQGTASNVFSRPHLVRAEVRERVRVAADSLGYRGPDPKGRLLRAGKVNAIGVATAEPLAYFFDDPFARDMMAGIAEACDTREAGLALVSAKNDKRLAWNIQSALVDGFLLFCVEGGARLVELTRRRGLPFIALELGLADPTIPAIGVDNFAAARLAADHLVGLGHRRFAVIAMPFADDRCGPVTLDQVEAAIYSDSRDRLHGYFDALRDAGIDPAGVPILETQNDTETSAAAMEAIFSVEPRPTALLVMSDRTAMAALDWLRARSIRVPEEVSVIGFDGVPDAAFAEPPLTTIAQPIREIGRRAVAAVLDHEPGTVHRELLDVELVIRASTAPPPERAGAA